MCTPKTFSQVDENQFNGWKANASKKGIQLEGETSGKLQWAGISGTFKWNASTSDLTVDLQIASTPRNCDRLYKDLSNMIPQAGAQAPVAAPGPALSIDEKGRYTVIGRVLRTGEPLSGIRVQAWDADQVGPDDKLGQDHTNENGYFTISFDPESFNDWGLDRHPDLYFKMFDGEHMIGESSGNTLHNAKPDLEDIVIDLPASSIPRD